MEIVRYRPEIDKVYCSFATFTSLKFNDVFGNFMHYKQI